MQIIQITTKNLAKNNLKSPIDFVAIVHNRCQSKYYSFYENQLRYFAKKFLDYNSKIEILSTQKYS